MACLFYKIRDALGSKDQYDIEAGIAEMAIRNDPGLQDHTHPV